MFISNAAKKQDTTLTHGFAGEFAFFFAMPVPAEISTGAFEITIQGQKIENY